MTDKKSDCILDLPYPDISAVKPDRHFAERVSALYAGRYGEFTAVSTYSYQQFILKEDFAYLSDVIECISLVEMHHFELLAELILRLGGDPVIGETQRRRVSYWNGSYAGYARRPERIIADNIRAERRAIADYTAAADSTTDKAAASLLRRIAKDEEYHLKLFQQLQEKYV